MPTPTDDNRELLTVIAFMRRRRQARGTEGGARGSDRADQARGRIRQLRTASGRGRPNFFTFYENWVSGEKFDAHLAAPHLVNFAAKMGGLLDDQGLSINRVRRIA